jgi:hypothetical protein
VRDLRLSQGAEYQIVSARLGSSVSAKLRAPQWLALLVLAIALSINLRMALNLKRTDATYAGNGDVLLQLQALAPQQPQQQIASAAQERVENRRQPRAAKHRCVDAIEKSGRGAE